MSQGVNKLIKVLTRSFRKLIFLLCKQIKLLQNLLFEYLTLMINFGINTWLTKFSTES